MHMAIYLRAQVSLRHRAGAGRGIRKGAPTLDDTNGTGVMATMIGLVSDEAMDWLRGLRTPYFVLDLR